MVHTPVLGSPGITPTAKANQKLKNAIIGQTDSVRENAVCPSLPKRVSPSNTPPTSADGVRRSSTGPLPAPPSSNKVDQLVPRRVKSGPKERVGPVIDETIRVRSGPTNRSLLHDQAPTESEEGQWRSGSGKKGERAGSGDRRKKKPHSAGERPAKDELALYYDEQVKPLLCQMEEKFAGRNGTELCQDCLRLWHVLDRKAMIGKASGSSSSRRRGEILRTIFKFLDITEPRLLLRLGRLILSVSYNLTSFKSLFILFLTIRVETHHSFSLSDVSRAHPCILGRTDRNSGPTKFKQVCQLRRTDCDFGQNSGGQVDFKFGLMISKWVHPSRF